MKLLPLSLACALPLMLLADMDRCVSCHGLDFEKKALGVSRVVKNMSEAEIKKALDGYKAGKGGSMKALMMQEVNLGVDTDAMAADVYNEAHTPGFEEPKDSFIFKKRYSVRALHKIKTALKKMNDPQKELPKVVGQIKATAFTMLVRDSDLRAKVHLGGVRVDSPKMDPKAIYASVAEAKKCVDHSFDDKALADCNAGFVTLASQLVEKEGLKMKAKAKKAPLYTGEGAVPVPGTGR